MIRVRVKWSDRPALVDDDRSDLVLFAWKLDKHGYVIRKLKTRNVYLHHLAIKGVGAPGQIRDHEDRDKMNNQSANLRWVTRRESNQNRGPAARNKTGYRGVMQIGDRYRAAATLDKKQHYLGMFDTAEEARDAAQAWRDQHMTHADRSAP